MTYPTENVPPVPPPPLNEPKDPKDPGFQAVLAAQQHEVEKGENATEIAERYDLTVEQLQAMNPELRENPGAIGEDDTLSILSPELLSTVEASVRKTEQTKDQQAVDMLVPGFLDAGLKAGLDETAMNQALNEHGAAITPIGDGQEGFGDIVNQARTKAQQQINDIFGRQVAFTDTSGNTRTTTIRELVAAAEGTPQASRTQDASPEWQNVKAGMVALMDDLGQESVDAAGENAGPEPGIRMQTARNIAQILGAATPNGDMDPATDPYLSAVQGAGDEVLIHRPLRAIQAAADNPDLDLQTRANTVPALTELVNQTEGLPPELAAQLIEASEGIIRQEVGDLYNDSMTHETGAFPSDDAKVKDLMNSLSILADRAYGAEGGEEVIQDLASSLTSIIDRASGFGGSESLSLTGQMATGGREAIGNGGSTLLLQEMARQLMDPQGGVHKLEASSLLTNAGLGVEDLQGNLETTGNDLYTRVILPAGLGQQNLGESADPNAHANGVKALLEENQELIDRGNRLTQGTVLSLGGHAQGLPPELRDLEGAGELQDALSALEGKVNQDPTSGDGGAIRPIPLLMQASPGATLAGQRVAQEQALQSLRNVPPEDFDRLLDQLGQLPEDDPYAPLAAQVLGLEDPKAVLYDSPELTLALFDRFSEADPADPDVPSAPNAGFLSRAGRDALAEVFAFRWPAGNSPMSALMPPPGMQSRTWGLSLPNSGLVDAASRAVFGDKPVEARSGIPSRAHFIPAWNTGSALLNAWGFATLIRSDVPIDKAWGAFFGLGTAMDAARVIDASRTMITGKPGFSQISGLRAWEWLPRVFNGAGLVLVGGQLGYELLEGDLPMAAAWTPAFAGSLYAAIPGAAFGGPVVAAGFVITAIATTAIAQHRRVEESNKLEGPIGTYLEAALPDVDKPESLANSDENGNPYLGLNTALAEAQGVSPEKMVMWLYSLPRDERDRLIDHALQVKPDDNGNYPVESDGSVPYPHGNDDTTGYYDPSIGDYRYLNEQRGAPGFPSMKHQYRMDRGEIESIGDFQRWARENGYTLPVG